MPRPFLYVPVQRWKPAEQVALSNLADELRAITCPLIEVCPPRFPRDPRRAGQTEQELATIAEQLLECCRGYSVFLDLAHLDSKRPRLICRNRIHPLTFLFTQLKTRRCLFEEHGPTVIPVIGLARSPAYRNATREVVRTGNQRLAVRLSRSEIQDSQMGLRLEELLRQFNLEPEDVDVIVDVKMLPRTTGSVGMIEHNLPLLSHWRSITVLLGAFPKDLQGFKNIGRHDLPRSDWLLFREHVCQSSGLAGIAAFGDYTIQHPIYCEPPDNCNPSASIRYATDDGWIIMRGEGIRNKGGPGAKQWRAQAQVMTKLDEFHGVAFSYGCRYIAEAALPSNSPGNPETWLGAMSNHHMTVVGSQIRKVLRADPKRDRRKRRPESS